MQQVLNWLEFIGKLSFICNANVFQFMCVTHFSLTFLGFDNYEWLDLTKNMWLQQRPPRHCLVHRNRLTLNRPHKNVSQSGN